jgi:hypothetical protein
MKWTALIILCVLVTIINGISLARSLFPAAATPAQVNPEKDRAEIAFQNGGNDLTTASDRPRTNPTVKEQVLDPMEVSYQQHNN